MSSVNDFDVAIIGMAGRFPGAADIGAFWNNLVSGREGLTSFAEDELEVYVDAAQLRSPDFVKAGGFLDEVELFDASLFNISTREAELIDPQQRLFLESSWQAIEDAGYDPLDFPGRVAVYAGVNTNTYLLSRLDQLSKADPAEFFRVLLASEKDHLATRVSYKLNLRGESITVQTSCSTSLVAAHLACQSIISGQCNMALAGGVSIRIPQKTGYFYQEGMVVSPDGHCRPFDAAANGTVPGNGCGVVLLKLASEASADGDHIYAVIKASAINNDGNDKVGYTAPSVQGQADVIGRALAMSGVKADEIGFVEAHGTGTQMGDPIEIEALTRVFRKSTDRQQYCVLGSVKSTIGHLDNAAGIAGLIKTSLALQRGLVPGTLHYRRANPMLGLDHSPFRVSADSLEWPAGTSARYAGLSSFGIGGTNVHMILGEAPARAARPDSRRVHILTLSAKSPEGVRTMASQMADAMQAPGAPPLADAAFTLNRGRHAFAHRDFVVAASQEEAASLFRQIASRKDSSPATSANAPLKIAFLFPGQGVVKPGMARALYENEPEFRKHLDAAFELMRDRFAFDLKKAIYGPHADEAVAANALSKPATGLPALFAIEYAFAQLWAAWGIRPAAVCGHSFGEYAACCFAGVFTLADGLMLALERGRLLERLSAGAMTAVRAPADQLSSLLPRAVVISAINSPNDCTVSGPVHEIQSLEADLRARVMAFARMDVQHAYHSAAVDMILRDFSAVISRVRLKEPSIPVVSSVTGTRLGPGQVTTPDYWTAQMRRCVRFDAALDSLHGAGITSYLELLPAPVTASFVKQKLGKSTITLPMPARAQDDYQAVLRALGTLWKVGAEIDWRGFYRHTENRRAALPTYSFERKRYWIDAPALKGRRVAGHEANEVLAPAAEPEIAVVANTLAATEVHARNDLERSIAAVWSEVLGQRVIRVDESFFDLGGDSLAAAQIFARLQRNVAADFSLQDVLAFPTIAEFAAFVEARGSTAGKDNAVIGVAPRTGELPLSFIQESLWLHEQFHPPNAAYNLPAAVVLAGALDIAALEKSLNEVIRRHETLRTTFSAVNGRPRMVVHPAEPLRLIPEQLAALELNESDAAVQEWIQRQASAPFDLERGPLARISLAKLAPGRHVLVFTLHHIIADAWSAGILVREVAALYQAYSRGSVSPLPELALQFADFAIWQRKRFDTVAVAGVIEYWKAKLAGAPEFLPLPLNTPRPPQISTEGARLSFHFAPELTAALKALAKTQGVTPFSLLFTIFQVLLAKISGVEDVVIGVPVAGRTRVEWEPLIGCFINTLAIRSAIHSSSRFRELCGKTQAAIREAIAYQDFPFEKVIEALAPRRDPAITPVYQVIFDYVNTPAHPVQLPEITLSPLLVDTGAVKMDLLVDMWEADGEFAGQVEFRSKLFKPHTIKRWINDFEYLAEQIASQPDRPIHQFHIRSKAQSNADMSASSRRDAELRRRFSAIKPRPIRAHS